MTSDNLAQNLLWSLPNTMGATWWLLCAAFALPGAFAMFLYMIMNQRFSGLLIARMLIVGSLLCFGLTPLNSGWMPWGVLLASIGGAYASFLIATNWCERHDKWEFMWSLLRGRRSERNDAQRPAHE